jgi:hypothetical protein
LPKTLKIAQNYSVARMKKVLNLNMKLGRLTMYKKIMAVFGRIFQIYTKADKQRRFNFKVKLHKTLIGF